MKLYNNDFMCYASQPTRSSKVNSTRRCYFTIVGVCHEPWRKCRMEEHATRVCGVQTIICTEFEGLETA